MGDRYADQGGVDGRGAPGFPKFFGAEPCHNVKYTLGGSHEGSATPRDQSVDRRVDLPLEQRPAEFP